jgi:hypothetical protein
VDDVGGLEDAFEEGIGRCGLLLLRCLHFEY